MSKIKIEPYFYDIQVPQCFNTLGEMQNSITPPFVLRYFPNDHMMVDEIVKQVNDSCDKILKLHEEYLGEDIVDEDNCISAKYNKSHKDISKYFHPMYFKMVHDQAIILYERMTTLCRKVVDMIENIITLGRNPLQFGDANYAEAWEALTAESEIFNCNMIANVCDAGFEIDEMIDNVLSHFYQDLNDNVTWFDPEYDNDDEEDLVDIEDPVDHLMMHDFIRTIIHKYDPTDENNMIRTARENMHNEISRMIEAINVLYYTKTMPEFPTKQELNALIENL